MCPLLVMAIWAPAFVFTDKVVRVTALHSAAYLTDTPGTIKNESLKGMRPVQSC